MTQGILTVSKARVSPSPMGIVCARRALQEGVFAREGSPCFLPQA